MSERDAFNLLGWICLGVTLGGLGVMLVSWVVVAYCRIAKWRIHRTMSRETQLTAAFTALARSQAEVARLSRLIEIAAASCECNPCAAMKDRARGTE